jgi:hypothetical protein
MKIHRLYNTTRNMFVGGDPLYLGAGKGHVPLTNDLSKALLFRRRSVALQARDELAARTGEAFILATEYDR